MLVRNSMWYGISRCTVGVKCVNDPLRNENVYLERIIAIGFFSDLLKVSHRFNNRTNKRLTQCFEWLLSVYSLLGVRRRDYLHFWFIFKLCFMTFSHDIVSSIFNALCLCVH